jgi:anti-sigma regulatory factor (Ser/Thr protein kinase)
MEVTTRVVAVREQTDVAEARRVATRLADELAFPEADAGRAALVATELATNLLKHADGGDVLTRAVVERPEGGLEILSIDKGPGMADVAACLEDGYSTAGSFGTGLGAIARASSTFEIYSRPGHGTIVQSRIAPAGPRPEVTDGGVSFGAISVSYPGERECGDGWALARSDDRVVLLVVDGLGHGLAASQAARRAEATFMTEHHRDPGAIVERLHDGLRSTRGAAVSVAEVRPRSSTVRHCGLGNVGVVLVGGHQSRQLVSMNGTAGHEAPRIREFEYPWGRNDLLVTHSDGLHSRWQLATYAGLQQAAPSLVAAVLYRDARRGRDDATVCVLRVAGDRGTGNDRDMASADAAADRR